MVNQGDIYYVEDLSAINRFPCNLKGLHPVIVMSNNKNNKNCSFVDVVPLTSRVKKAYLPTHVWITREDCPELKCNSQFVGELYQAIGIEDLKEENYIGSIVKSDLMEKFGNAIISHITN